MFDIGFWELMIIGVVALVVIGPERLPGVARTAGMWLGKARKMVVSVKHDIDRELKAEELKRIIEEQARSSGIHDIIEETKSVAEDIKSGVEKTASDAEHEYLVDAIPDEPEQQAKAAQVSAAKPTEIESSQAVASTDDQSTAVQSDEPAKH